MSQETVELLRASYDALNRAYINGEDVRVLMEGVDPEFVGERRSSRISSDVSPQ